MCDKEKKKKKKRKFGPPLVLFRAREWALLTRGGDESHVSRGWVDWGQRPTFISALRS